jgi:2-dehydropantoate 2-reductase
MTGYGRIIPDHVVLPSCVYVASHIKEKGIVEHKESLEL